MNNSKNFLGFVNFGKTIKVISIHSNFIKSSFSFVVRRCSCFLAIFRGIVTNFIFRFTLDALFVLSSLSITDFFLHVRFYMQQRVAQNTADTCLTATGSLSTNRIVKSTKSKRPYMSILKSVHKFMLFDEMTT